MAHDEHSSQPRTSIPSLLTGRPSLNGAGEPPRILAALEGRAPFSKVKCLSSRRRCKARWLISLALCIGVAGMGLWAGYGIPELPLVVSDKPPRRAIEGLPQSTSTVDPLAAAIIEDRSPSQPLESEADGDMETVLNPLSRLTMTAPFMRLPLASNESNKAFRPAEQRSKPVGPMSEPRQGKAAPREGGDAAVLGALMSHALPPASPPGTNVYKAEGTFIRELPGSSLRARLAECLKLSFLEGEQCRLRVCAGHWGIAPECPNVQSNAEP